jgi:hypothetical protein
VVAALLLAFPLPVFAAEPPTELFQVGTPITVTDTEGSRTVGATALRKGTVQETVHLSREVVTRAVQGILNRGRWAFFGDGSLEIRPLDRDSHAMTMVGHWRHDPDGIFCTAADPLEHPVLMTRFEGRLRRGGHGRARVEGTFESRYGMVAGGVVGATGVVFHVSARVQLVLEQPVRRHGEAPAFVWSAGEPRFEANRSQDDLEPLASAVGDATLESIFQEAGEALAGAHDAIEDLAAARMGALLHGSWWELYPDGEMVIWPGLHPQKADGSLTTLAGRWRRAGDGMEFEAAAVDQRVLGFTGDDQTRWTVSGRAQEAERGLIVLAITATLEDRPPGQPPELHRQELAQTARLLQRGSP